MNLWEGFGSHLIRGHGADESMGRYGKKTGSFTQQISFPLKSINFE